MGVCFKRLGDEDFDAAMAEKFYVLVNIHKKWGTGKDFTATIKKVIFRGNAPWTRMDVQVLEKGREFNTNIGEFIEHYYPENGEKYNANKLFKKIEKHYGFEYEENI